MIQGLSEHEVTIRRAKGQGNNVNLGTSRSYQQIFFNNIFTFINMVLFAIGFVLILLGLPGDALATAGLVFMNVIVGVIQEIRAKQKLDQIALLSRPKITALRDGQETVIDPSEIVHGDILRIRPGDQIVVDGNIIDEGRIEVDEALLTGESDNIPKSKGDTVYSGSFCVTGNATYEATKVGAESFANKMTSQARNFQMMLTPLQKDVNFIVRLLALISFTMGLLLYIAAERSDAPFAQSVQSLAVVVGLVPQGLIFLTTLSYALGAVRMAGKGALIQQSSAVESMSNVSVLCLDKTGTLTTNRIKYEDVCPFTMSAEEFKRLIGVFAASGTAQNATSEAILAGNPQEKLAFTGEIPFSSARKWSALAFDQPNTKGLYVMGAPEMIEPHLKPGTDFHTPAQAWMEQGLRVVMLAHHDQIPSFNKNKDERDPKLPDGLTPLGLIALSDEIRKEAEDTLKGFVEAGIKIKIISGDNPQTVAALAKQVKFPGLEDAVLLTGTEIAKMEDHELAHAAENATIFGRITPYQKEKLVRALQSRGAYVAMIGDGVNDVLSLKQAQIGISMQSGSAATRNVADIVLLNDSFAVLPDAFKEGQKIINGMQDIVRILLSRTFYMVFLIISAAMMRIDFPLKPTYDTLVTALTVGIPGPALAAWARSGRPARSTLKSMIHFVFPAAFTIAALSAGLYLYFLETSNDVILARTALTLTLGICGLMLLPFVEPPTPIWVAGDDYSGDWRPTWMAIGMGAILLAIFLIPGLRDAFDLATLSLQDYAIIFVSVGAWGWILRLIWLHRIFERFLGIDL